MPQRSLAQVLELCLALTSPTLYPLEENGADLLFLSLQPAPTEEINAGPFGLDIAVLTAVLLAAGAPVIQPSAEMDSVSV